MQTHTISPVARLKKPLLRATIGLFGLSAAMGIFFVIGGPEGEAWKFLATTTLLAFFSLFTSNNILRLDNSSTLIKALATAAIVSNLLWALPWLAVIWDFLGSSWSGLEYMWRTIWAFTVLSICLTLTGGFLTMKQSTPGFQVARYTAIASAWLLYIYLLPAIVGISDGDYLGKTWQLIAIGSIVFAFSAISTPILANLKLTKPQSTASDDHAQLRAELKKELKAELRAEIEAEIRAERELEQDKKVKD